ncbi:SMP-30/gluconolactonase/LRE family protein [Marinobacter sp. M1N3S26]|uniref:SMP-30/gluconolactonase/LRE family protein n=1 Tax=Marinobacter sp. M1N3S26 TaxID=3382299 RepID=UPI00387B6719
MKRLLVPVVFVLVAVVLWVLFWPSPVDSVAYQPPKAPPMTGPLAPNNTLQQADLLAVGELVGPEDVAVDDQGRVYGGTHTGSIMRIGRDGSVEDWVQTGGRPLGLEFDAAGNLIVCDAWKGLLSVSPEGDITVLATEADGVSFAFTDDLDIAADGTIYFSDASSRFHQPDYKLDLLEARPHGRLLKYEPSTGETTVLMEDLYFANGIAVDPDEAFVLVNETYRYRVQRFWLSGEKAGQSELFVDNLPGFPDGISRDPSGRFWVALATPRNATVDRIHPTPWIKNVVAKLPDAIQPQAQRYGFALALDENGEILTSLHDPSGEHLQEITSVEVYGDDLYFGTLHNDRIGRLPLSEVTGL